VRISHDKTAKGWRCNETTVEISHFPTSASVEDMQRVVRNALQSGHAEGLDESRRRNLIEGFAP
jgi:hypothetical protein